MCTMKGAEYEKTIDNLVIGLLMQGVGVLLAVRIFIFHQQELYTTHIVISMIAVFNFAIVIIVGKWLVRTHFLYQELDDAIKLMRSERHDFINHMVSVYGLILAGDKKSAMEYLKDLNYNFSFNTQILNINNPYLCELLKNKSRLAAGRGIEFKLKVKSRLEKFKMKPSAVTTVFANLIDNAIDAVEDTGGEKVVEFIIDEVEGSYKFWVRDSGPPIDDQVLKAIFTRGFSTKGRGRGFGMALVRDVVRQYHGQVVYNNDPKGFCVIIPGSGGFAS